MNDRAREIWEAWLDGKQLQRYMPWHQWEDEDPNETEVDEQPQNKPKRWRIRRTKTVEYRYRIAILDNGTDHPVHKFVYPEEYLEYEKQTKAFLKWATDEIVGEVERPL